MKKAGYVEISRGTGVNRTRILEHRLVMETHLRRKLGRLEYVHHINGNTRDNRIENLQVMTPAEHNREHYLGKYRNPNNTTTHRQCPTCKLIYRRDDPLGFRKDSTNRGGGLARQCLQCVREANREAVRRYRKRKKLRP